MFVQKRAKIVERTPYILVSWLRANKKHNETFNFESSGLIQNQERINESGLYILVEESQTKLTKKPNKVPNVWSNDRALK